MALQIWMPLNGNIDNYGLSDLNFSILSTNTTLNSSGKIGQCYQNDSNTDGGLLSSDVINLGQNQSMFCWMKFTSLMSSSLLGGGIISQHRYRSNTGMGLTIKYASSTTGYLSVNTGDGSSRTYNTYCATTLMHAGTWYHVGYTYDGTYIRLYVNGFLENTVTYTGMSVPADYISVFSWSMANTSGNTVHPNSKLKGSINDVRVYDHCLSQKEVNDISKGLIVHYPLSTRDVLTNKYTSVTWNQILTNGDFSNGTSGWSGYSPNTITQISVENNELTVTKVGGTVGGFAYVNNVTFDTTHLYYVKAAVKALDVVDHDTHYATFGFSKTNGTVGGNTQIYIYSLEYTTRSFVSSPVNATDRLIVRAGKGQTSPTYSVKCKNIMCIDLTLMFGEGNEPTKEECDVIFYDDYYAYDPGTVKNISEPLYDYSGYGRNAVVPSATKLSLVSGSPRYDVCTANTVSYPLAAAFDFPESSGLTVSLWVNMGTIGFQGSGLFTTSNRVSGTPNDYNTTTFDHYDGSIRLYGTNGTLYSVTISATNDISTNTWSHIVLTHDGTNAKLYANGVLKRTVSVPTPLVGFKKLFLGTSWAGGTNRYCLGKWSDFRMYATALSERDIKELYNTSAHIDNLGNLCCYEIQEKVENLFKVEYINEFAEQSINWTTRNNEHALILKPTNFHQNSVYAHILQGKFKLNTQYKFDLWIDADDVVSNGSNVPGGLVVYYTDGTHTPSTVGSGSLTARGNSSSPIGFQHKVFYSDPDKSVDFLITYYYTSNNVYYRWDSVIIPMLNSTSVEKNGIVETGQFREDTTTSRICKGDNFDINNIIEK